MINDGSGWSTYSNEPQCKPLTLERLEQIMLHLSDCVPALLVAVKVHPDCMEWFIANLREEGFCKAMGVHSIDAVEIVADPDVPKWEFRLVFAGDKEPECP